MRHLKPEAWFLHHENNAICPDWDLNAEPLDLRTCVRTIRLQRFSNTSIVDIFQFVRVFVNIVNISQ